MVTYVQTILLLAKQIGTRKIPPSPCIYLFMGKMTKGEGGIPLYKMYGESILFQYQISI